jgi:hypothetical protein
VYFCIYFYSVFTDFVASWSGPLTAFRPANDPEDVPPLPPLLTPSFLSSQLLHSACRRPYLLLSLLLSVHHFHLYTVLLGASASQECALISTIFQHIHSLHSRRFRIPPKVPLSFARLQLLLGPPILSFRLTSSIIYITLISDRFSGKKIVSAYLRSNSLPVQSRIVE